jgi:hypothetical protein
MGLSALGEFELLSLVGASFLYRIGQQTDSHPPTRICQKQQTINRILVSSESKIRRRAGNYSGNLAVCGQDVSVHGM